MQNVLYKITQTKITQTNSLRQKKLKNMEIWKKITLFWLSDAFMSSGALSGAEKEWLLCGSDALGKLSV